MDDIFEGKSAREQIISENVDQVYWSTTHVTTEDGYMQWLEGATFPRRSLCEPETMHKLNIVKRLTVGFLKMWPLIFFNKKKLFNIYVDICWKVMNDKIMKYRLMTPLAQEIQDMSYSFTQKLGFGDGDCIRFSKVFSCIVEYDDAYRYRIEDIMTETTKWELIARPYSEFKHLSKIIKDRDDPTVGYKFGMIIKYLYLFLLIPKVRKAFNETLEECNFSKLQMDNIDFYWCCMRKDYKYGGFSHEQREKIFKERGWVVPKVLKVTK